MAEQSQAEKYDAESEAVRAHLSILQAVIQRMAGNSASCKMWCVLMVVVMLLLSARKDMPLAFIPAVLFLFLDTYYLALERAFRDSYNAFVGKLHKGEVALSDLYVVRPRGRIGWQFAQSLGSSAIWPFYNVLVILIWLVWKLA